MSDKANIPKSYGNIKADEPTKVKRQGLKFFDSAEWAMKSQNQSNSAFSKPLPKPTDELIQKFKQRYSRSENQTSPIAGCDA